MKFAFSRFLGFPFSRFLILAVAVTLLISQASAQVVEIPDSNLERAIRETLQLPPNTPITQQEMGKLESLDISQMEIAYLTGLEHTNLYRLGANDNQITNLTPLSGLEGLKHLSLWGNPISDLSPLASLTQLRYLHLGLCEISNLSPLTGLTGLTNLYLHGNQISDIKPLAELTQLTHLWLGWNLIMDVSPLSNLTRLTELILSSNPIIDYSPLDGLSLAIIERDEVCELPYLPIKERLQNRTFPSVFSAFGRSDHSSIRNLPGLSTKQKLALHDLNWHLPYFTLRFWETDKEWVLAGPGKTPQQLRDSLLSLNPNMLFIAQILVRDEFNDRQPEDWPHWLRDADGNRIPAYPEEGDSNLFLTDFTQPDMQDMIVQQAIAVGKCGLFDGIFFDWFAEWGTVLHGYYSYEEEQRAKDTILQRIRASVRDDFLIIINTNRSKIPRRAWGINGTFMETLQDIHSGWTVTDGNPYGYEGLKQIESTLLWAEENLREPQINSLEGWGLPDEPPDSPTNLRFMRVFTTMSLTLSDGYVVYTSSNPRANFWYSFWNADLGRPIGSKAQQYQDIEGLYIREFTNGWAVYNRSGKEQPITLPRISTGVSSNKTDITHLLPDLDGEIYMRVGKPFDLNRDGTVNVLDLILISQHLGTPQGDINGDGITNILDLTLVAQQFSK